MKLRRSFYAVGLLLSIAMLSGPVFATGTHTCPYGGTPPKCNPKPPDPPTPTDPGQQQDQNQEQQQQQDQTANGGTGVGIGVGKGGAGGHGGHGGDGGSVGDTTAKVGDTTSLSGVVGSGNSTNDLSNTVRDSGNSSSNSGAAAISGSKSGVKIGDTTLNNDSNSGGNTLSNGSESSSGASSDNSGGNNDVDIDTSDRSSDSYESQALFIPSVQVAPPNIVAGSTVIIDRGVCGPKQSVVTEDVYGIYIGMLSQRKVYLGKTDRLAMIDGAAFDVDVGQDGVTRLLGERPVYRTAVIGVAGSRSLGLGGGKTGGDWANAGASGGSSMQRMVTQIDRERCEYARTAPKTVTVPVVDEVPQG